MVLASLGEIAIDFMKLERFDSENFFMLAKKMHFFLPTFKVFYILNTPRAAENENKTVA